MNFQYTFENITLKFDVIDGTLFCRDYGFGEVVLENAEDQHKNIVQVHLRGQNQNDHHFSKHSGASENMSLKYVDRWTFETENGEMFAICQRNERIEVITYYFFYRGVNGYAIRNVVKNIGKEKITLEYVSSLYLAGFSSQRWEKDSRVFIPHNYWKAEASWREYSFPELGFYNVGQFTAKRVSIANTGTWSTKEYLPMGMFKNTETGKSFLFQIESNAAWQYEYSTIGAGLYLTASGPSFTENSWSKTLSLGEEFTTCKTAIIFGEGLDDVFGEMTKYRRMIRKFKKAPFRVYFNDYMNCLDTDTTEENDKPFIELAAKVGCDCYVIDTGWYDDGEWYHNTGHWIESKRRYPHGLKNFLGFIKSKGLVPGLWVEIEVQSIEIEYANNLPDSWFFLRDGKRVADNYRYMLNFGNPEVVEFAKGVIDDMVCKYGAEFIKMDHNINGGVGSDGESYGETLRKHAEGYRNFIYDIKKKYPNVEFENCASGGCRMDYALLDLYDLQSTSDQTNYVKYAPISANVATACLPEQAGVWCYPLANATKEETTFNMVNSILHRVYLAGRIDKIDDDCLNLVKEAIQINKSLAEVIQNGMPIFPLGLNKYDAPYVCYGLKYLNKIYLAVWNIEQEGKIEIDLNAYGVKKMEVVYPKSLQTDYAFENGTLKIESQNIPFARLFCGEIN